MLKAAYEGDKNSIVALFKACADLALNKLTRKNRLPLHAAALNGHVDVVKELLIRGADINSTTKDTGFTALHFSSQAGHDNVVKMLLQNDQLSAETLTSPTIQNRKGKKKKGTAKNGKKGKPQKNCKKNRKKRKEHKS